MADAFGRGRIEGLREAVELVAVLETANTAGPIMSAQLREIVDEVAIGGGDVEISDLEVECSCPGKEWKIADSTTRIHAGESGKGHWVMTLGANPGGYHLFRVYKDDPIAHLLREIGDAWRNGVQSLMLSFSSQQDFDEFAAHPGVLDFFYGNRADRPTKASLNDIRRGLSTHPLFSVYVPDRKTQAAATRIGKIAEQLTEEGGI